MTAQEFLADAAEKAATALETAYLRLPEDKRDYKPADSARSALDQLIECATLNGYTAELLATRAWPPDRMEGYLRDKVEYAALDWETLRARLHENARRVAAAIRATPDDALTVPVEMPWGSQTMLEICAYSLWNMTYHEGQINYIASLLGRLA